MFCSYSIIAFFVLFFASISSYSQSNDTNLSVSSSAKAVIKSNIMALKAAMKKGQPHFKKRLFGNLFNQLLVTENGIKVFYELEEQSNLNGSERQKKKPSDSKSDGISIFTKSLFSQPLGFLVSNGSSVVTYGGGDVNPL